MLAKMWKKILLAICIIACIYNIMSKLVNRGSLEANLRKANDGNTVFDFSSKESENDFPEIVDEVITKNAIVENTLDYDIIEDETMLETPEEEEEAEENNTNSGAVKFTDFIFKW